MLKEVPDEEQGLIKQRYNIWEQLLYNTKMQIILVLILCAFIGIGTPFIWQQIWKPPSDSCAIESDLRYDCFPQKPSLHKNETECYLANCCWDKHATEGQIQCYYGLIAKNDGHKMPGYKIESSVRDSSAKLIIDKLPSYIKIDNNDTNEGPIVHKKLALNIYYYSETHLSVRIAPQNDDVQDIYPEFDPDHIIINDTIAQNPRLSEAKVTWDSKFNASFTLSVRRRDTDHVIFNTGEYSPFIYCDGFIEITTLLPNDYMYGLGQSPSRGFKHNMTYPEDWDVFSKYNLNLTTTQGSWFGAHPFYLGRGNDGNSYGILLRNTYPIQTITNSRPSLTFRTVGGHLDFHFFLGPKPDDVYRQYSNLLRRPSLPPYWALGFHMCRTTCDLNKAINIVQDMRSKSVPFESDCGSAALSSNVFSTRMLKRLRAFYNKTFVDSKTRNFIVQVPHKIAGDAFQERWEGKNEYKDLSDIRHRWSGHGLKDSHDLDYQGYFYDWCEYTDQTNNSVIYPSYLEDTPTIEKALEDDLKLFTDDMNGNKGIDRIDGMFLDYNTPLDLSYTRQQNMSIACEYIANNTWNKYFYWDLNKYTPCLDSHYPNHENISHLSLHNLYGYQHIKMTKRALDKHKNTNKERKLVMSLSTFAGSGHMGGHIGTNMNATWEMLEQTVYQVLEFNMYGIPLTGFPVCGFKGHSSDKELCLRWYQLAAMQPFMISHTDFNQNLTDPLTFANGGADNAALDAIRNAIHIRYQLLPYLYTQFYRAHIYGEPVVRPLFYEFPDDKKTYRIDKQYLWGKALLMSPVTREKAANVEAYFPEGTWYDYYSGRRIAVKDSQNLNLSAIEYHINLHIKGGHVLPIQPPGQNTIESRNKPFRLIAALNKERKATGQLFIDDGISEDTTSAQNPKYLLPEFSVDSRSITIVTDLAKVPDLKDISTKVDQIKIYGIIDPLDPPLFNVTRGTHEPVFYNNSYYRFDSYLGVLTLFLDEMDIDFKTNSDYFFNWDYKKWS